MNMNQTDTIAVRQRAYALLTPSSLATKLETRKINFCTAFVGVNKEKGIAFLCHLDVPTSTNAIDEICEALRTEHGGMDGFELYAVSRFGPFKRSLFALGIVWFFWEIVGFNSAALALITSIASLVTLWLFLWPQLMMYCAAWRHFKKKVAWRSPKGIGRIFGTMGVQIDLKSAQSVRASWDTPDELKARWVEKSSTALKANKSDEA